MLFHVLSSVVINLTRSRQCNHTNILLLLVFVFVFVVAQFDLSQEYEEQMQDSQALLEEFDKQLQEVQTIFIHFNVYTINIHGYIHTINIQIHAKNKYTFVKVWN